MSDTERSEINWPTIDLSEDPGDIYFCTPCKIDFRRSEDLNNHLKLKEHKRNKRYQEKIYNRRFFRVGDVEEGPLLMSEVETSEEEDETTKYEREVLLDYNLCVSNGYGVPCTRCANKRMAKQEKGNFDFKKMGKHLEKIYQRMVVEYGDDPSIPSSEESDDDLNEMFQKTDALIKSLSDDEGTELDENNQEEQGEKKKSDKVMDDDISLDEVLQDPDSGYENLLPKVVSIDGEELNSSDSDIDEGEWNEVLEDPFGNQGGELPQYNTMRGKIRFSNKIKQIPL